MLTRMTSGTRHEQRISFYRHVPEIFHRLREAGVLIAACSRTSAPDLCVALSASAHTHTLTHAYNILKGPASAEPPARASASGA